ncbi:protein EARLY FLOWERING 3 [Malania oleifera]|uniref:protein EARLY FLOWERING 3 n=1 Tax=Malania oleifera TaxID=397392 RepID=UPI0025AE1750|nr:protein EARLY FLOWERING 3 [Malania oleifera]
MKRGKDEGKIMGPMFPRLHVNDTEKGGPRAPPRNKMALYEQLSIPSQRFNHGVMPLNPSNNATSMVPSGSTSHGNGHDRNMHFPRRLIPSTPADLAERLPTGPSDGVNLDTSLAQLDQGKKVGDEDDFMVPVFVHSEMDQCYVKTQNNGDVERVSFFSSSRSCHSNEQQNACDKDLKQNASGLSLRQEANSKGEENPSSRDYMLKSATNMSTRRELDGSAKQVDASSNQEHQGHPRDNFKIFCDTDTFLQEEHKAGSKYEGIACGDGFPNEPLRDEQRGSALRMLKSDSHSGIANSNPNEPDNDGEYCGDRTHGSLQTGTVDRSDDISETSMVDSISGLDISPDDVVGIMGQKLFWKARRAIVNQQRVFAVQVFELHRLMKVQKLIAASPHLLIEDDAYLGKPTLKGSSAKRLASEYIVKPRQHSLKQRKDESEKPTHDLECSAENAVGKTSISSAKNGSQPSNCGPCLGDLPPAPVTDAKMGPWCFHQPPGHQWLVPVMSPSEGLIYKPYLGPGFVAPICGGCGPTSSSPLTGNFLNSAYGVPASHHRSQGMLPGALVGHGYFPPYGMPTFNPAASGSAVEQANWFAGLTSNGQTTQFSGGRTDINVQCQSSGNVLGQKNGAISHTKFQASKDGEVQGSTESNPAERTEAGTGPTAVGRDALPLFPGAVAAAAAVVPEGDSQTRDTDQPARVIRVVPHNRRSATESAARIFQSIQEERKQCDTI